jgi:predicted Rossmann-fold nucleotide-binding protein
LSEPEVIHSLFSLTNSPVTRSEIAEIIKLLQDKKTQDYCVISINFIKNFSDQLVKPLQHIINLSFETSVVPSQMKIAKVIPLFKSGGTLS